MVLNFEFYSAPNDEYWQNQWHFQNTGQNGGTADADIDLDEALDYTQSPSAYVTIAVIDDGFAVHEDFPSSRFVGGYGYASPEGPDFAPYQFAAHGMGTMGIIAATNNNSDGVAGISNNFRVIPQRIGNQQNGLLTASDGNIARAFSDAVLAGAQVISNSWGCTNCDALYDTTAYWISKSDSLGAVVVFSSGNHGSSPVGFPARLPAVLSVGATDKNDARWNYSGYGERLDVVAPSSGLGLTGDIWTLDQMGNLGYNPTYITCSPNDVDYDCKFGGTSAACPEVAGIVALVLRRRPDLVGNTEQLKEIIRHSSEDKGAAGWDQYFGWGRLNAARALLAVSRGDANNDGLITISDAEYIINYIFGGGPTPVPHNLTGDADGTGIITLSDSVFIIDYIFAGGPQPPVSYSY
ncbi:MAG: S8 family serine peptidase [Candidatus Zixiibacteriota bacterium]